MKLFNKSFLIIMVITGLLSSCTKDENTVAKPDEKTNSKASALENGKLIGPKLKANISPCGNSFVVTITFNNPPQYTPANNIPAHYQLIRVSTGAVVANGTVINGGGVILPNSLPPCTQYKFRFWGNLTTPTSNPLGYTQEIISISDGCNGLYLC